MKKWRKKLIWNNFPPTFLRFLQQLSPVSPQSDNWANAQLLHNYLALTSLSDHSLTGRFYIGCSLASNSNVWSNAFFEGHENLLFSDMFSIHLGQRLFPVPQPVFLVSANFCFRWKSKHRGCRSGSRAVNRSDLFLLQDVSMHWTSVANIENVFRGELSVTSQFICSLKTDTK